MTQTLITVPRPAAKSKGKAKADVLYAIAEDCRPTRGAALFAHTMAALIALGLAAPARPAASRSRFAALVGARAIKYHAGEGNLEVGSDTVRLSASGYEHFKARADGGKVPKDLMDAYLSTFTRGTEAPGVAAANIHPVA